jgi:hypothetical protein
VIALTLPEMTPGDWIGAIVDRHEIAGTTMHRVQLRGRDRGAVERNWFANRDEAMAFALDRADRRHLPVLDMTGGEAE